MSDKLRELAAKLRSILSKPASHWLVDGKAICYGDDRAPLMRDHAVHPQSLTLIAEALNFTVRRQALQEFADELAALAEKPAERPAVDRWTCPDCGYDSMPYPPKDYNICPKCMVEFGNDDRKSKMLEQRAERPQLSAELVRVVLAQHWLAGIHCHHATTPDDSTYDWATCACSEVNLSHKGTVGEAVGSWIEHVLAMLTGEAEKVPVRRAMPGEGTYNYAPPQMIAAPAAPPVIQAEPISDEVVAKRIFQALPSQRGGKRRSEMSDELANALEALEVIEGIVCDDSCENWSMGKFRGEKKEMWAKLSAVYRAAHSALPTSCHASHDDWRKETADKLALIRAERGAVRDSGGAK